MLHDGGDGLVGALVEWCSDRGLVVDGRRGHGEDLLIDLCWCVAREESFCQLLPGYRCCVLRSACDGFGLVLLGLLVPFCGGRAWLAIGCACRR